MVAVKLVPVAALLSVALALPRSSPPAYNDDDPIESNAYEIDEPELVVIGNATSSTVTPCSAASTSAPAFLVPGNGVISPRLAAAKAITSPVVTIIQADSPQVRAVLAAAATATAAAGSSAAAAGTSPVSASATSPIGGSAAAATTAAAATSG